MSTAISQTQISAILPKAVTKLKAMNKKPRLNRSSSIDTIKRINTYICSPQVYLLPAILTTWLKTGQNGLQSNAEKSIFMMRSLIFGSFLTKVMRSKSGKLSVPASKLDLSTVILAVADQLQEKLLLSLNSTFVISQLFKLAVVIMTGEICLCVFFILKAVVVPVGLIFLFLCAGYIGSLAHNLNRFYFMKRDVKRKLL